MLQRLNKALIFERCLSSTVVSKPTASYRYNKKICDVTDLETSRLFKTLAHDLIIVAWQRAKEQLKQTKLKRFPVFLPLTLQFFVVFS